jgi:hypothetical protein
MNLGGGDVLPERVEQGDASSAARVVPLLLKSFPFDVLRPCFFRERT